MDNTSLVEYRKSLRWYVVGIAIFALFLIGGIIDPKSGNWALAVLVGVILCCGIPRYISNRIILDSSSVSLFSGLISIREVKIPYSKIDSVDISWVWANGGNIEIISGGNTYRYKSMGRIEDLSQKLNVNIDAALVNAKASIISGVSQGVTAPVPNKVDELSKIAGLRDSGALTVEEFESMKQQIINS